MSTGLPVGYRAEKYALSSDSLGRRGFQPPGRRHRRISGGGGRISAGGRSVRLIGQAVLAGPECRLRAVVHADLAKQMTKLRLDRRGGGAQRAREQLVRPARWPEAGRTAGRER